MYEAQAVLVRGLPGRRPIAAVMRASFQMEQNLQKQQGSDEPL